MGTKQNIEIMLLAKMATDMRVATDPVEEVTTLHESKLRCQHLDQWLYRLALTIFVFHGETVCCMGIV